MVAGEIDLSIGSVYLFTPFMFYEFNEAGLSLSCCLVAVAWCVPRWWACSNGFLTAVDRHLLVHRHARHSARRGRPDPDHLQRCTGRHARRRGHVDDRDR